jgi:hypothetical protein
MCLFFVVFFFFTRPVRFVIVDVDVVVVGFVVVVEVRSAMPCD